MQYDFLQLVISSPLIHALGDQSQVLTGPTNWAIVPAYKWNINSAK